MSKKKTSKSFLFRVGLSKKFILSCIIFISICLGLYGLYEIFFPQIDLKGGKKVIIEYKADYKEMGYTAYHLGDDLTKDVTVSGKVNTDKLGEYNVTYTVGEGIFKAKVVRHVIVDDNTKPTIKISKGDMYLCPGDKIVAEEVTAVDNYDGDLTNKIKTEILKDKIVYSVEDSHGNKKVVTKKVVFKDVEDPVITLEGGEVFEMYADNEYKDPGYTARDNCDKKIQDKVNVSGNVDTANPGEYELTYMAEDDAGNKGSVVRKVLVNEPSRDGVVYLTFDDGPNEGTTDVILDILAREGVKATFFVTNKGPDYLIQREYNEGHTVALHTASHDYSVIYASDEAYFNDLQAVHDRVYNLTGYDSKIIRFPGGSSNTVSRHYSYGIMSRLTQEVVNRGYKYYDWNISSGDAGSTTDPNQVYLNVVNSLRRDRPNMVLMHDIKWYTRDALENIIHYCKENGYPMERITIHTEMITQRVNN